MAEYRFDPNDPEISALMHARAAQFELAKRQASPEPLTNRRVMQELHRKADPTWELDEPDPYNPGTTAVLGMAAFVRMVRHANTQGMSGRAALSAMTDQIRTSGLGHAHTFVILDEVFCATILKWANDLVSVFTDASVATAGLQAAVDRPAHRLDGRDCTRHGTPLRAGQCPRCQREQVRASSRGAQAHW